MNSRRSAGSKLLNGLLAGTLASAVMSLFFTVARRFLPRWQRYPLPPHYITLEISDRVGAEELVESEPEASLATAAGHIGYGAANGALYAALASSLPSPVVLRGLVFGLLLWAGSYLGWLPASRAAGLSSWSRRTLSMGSAQLCWLSVC
jgi:putative membrane protein